MKKAELKKQPLEKMRGIFFQSGLIIACGLTLVAFEWTTPIALNELPEPRVVTGDDFILPPVTYTVAPPKPEVKIEHKVIDPTKINIVKTIAEPIEPITEPYKEPVVFDQKWITVEEPVKEKDVPRIGAEYMPEFEGGAAGIFAYLKSNLKYPILAKESGIQGTVHLKFVVGKKGKIRNIEVLKGVNKLLDQEAVRVVKSMPDWKPGSQHGKPVSVYYTLPIKFTIM